MTLPPAPTSSATSSTVNFCVELTETQARHFAQFLKRVGWRDYRENAATDDEAYVMRDAGEEIRTALAEKGFAPR